MQKKAIIAMSGGVDSSVAAYLMVKDGYDCAGATLKLYDNPQCSFPGHRACQCMMNSATVSLTNLQILICTVAHRTRVLTVTVF